MTKARGNTHNTANATEAVDSDLLTGQTNDLHFCSGSQSQLISEVNTLATMVVAFANESDAAAGQVLSVAATKVG